MDTRAISIGNQSFADLRGAGGFYIDKTDFIRRWWDSLDVVTLVARPRRFGKTLTLSMVECFLSTAYAGRADLFEGLSVWGDPRFRGLQGTVPVVSLSFAGVKKTTFGGMVSEVTRLLRLALRKHGYLRESPALTPAERGEFAQLCDSMGESEAPTSLNALCGLLEAHWGVKPVVLLDEYDTPMELAWEHGFWDDAVDFVRDLFNNTFKTNASLGRALITGLTRVSRESIFSDLNNLKVVTTTTPLYEDCFGFTEAEVFGAMRDRGMPDTEGVKRWYDGFVFGGVADIYNPWSITNYLDEGRLAPYWANSGGTGLVSRCVARGDAGLKEDFRALLDGGAITKPLDEQVVFSQLATRPNAVWSLLLATGYLKAVSHTDGEGASVTLAVTNLETMGILEGLVSDWFEPARGACSDFCAAMLAGDREAMTAYLGEVALETFGTFDTGRRAAESFYHGFVLGLVVDLRGRFRVRSNRESGYGRYDVVLEPADPARDPGVVVEFKVCRRGQSLGDAVADALAQIEGRRYAEELVGRGVPEGRVLRYGIAFEGKDCLVG
ncbi:MAG: AAA family ATPase [Parafannyhessea sp.]|uniref:AAA family ATPase n=1 Tax=Parafannyhessea sp. TaxID=2847324 RepID=UPI003EFC0625